MQQRQRQTFISTSTRNNNINRTFVFLIRFNEISLEYQTTRKTLLIHILHKIATTYFSFSMSMPSMTFPFERLNQRKLLSIFSFLHIYNLLMKKKRVRDRQELPFSLPLWEVFPFHIICVIPPLTSVLLDCLPIWKTYCRRHLKVDELTIASWYDYLFS